MKKTPLGVALIDAVTFLLIQEGLWGRSKPQIDLLLKNLGVGSGSGTETTGKGSGGKSD